MKGLEMYSNACNELKDRFLESLYAEDDYDETDSYWVAEEVGGVLSFGDWSVGMNHIVDYFRYGYTPNEFFSWYDEWVSQECRLNMKNYKRMKKITTLTE